MADTGSGTTPAELRGDALFPKVGGELWAILYEDSEVAPEMFTGEGAKEAALNRFEQAANGYQCTLVTNVELRGDAPEPDWRAIADEAIKAVKGRWVSVSYDCPGDTPEPVQPLAQGEARGAALIEGPMTQTEVDDYIRQHFGGPTNYCAMCEAGLMHLECDDACRPRAPEPQPVLPTLIDDDPLNPLTNAGARQQRERQLRAALAHSAALESEIERLKQCKRTYDTNLTTLKSNHRIQLAEEMENQRELSEERTRLQSLLEQEAEQREHWYRQYGNSEASYRAALSAANFHPVELAVIEPADQMRGDDGGHCRDQNPVRAGSGVIERHVTLGPAMVTDGNDPHRSLGVFGKVSFRRHVRSVAQRAVTA